MMNDPNTYPPGWDREKVQNVIEYYELQTTEDYDLDSESSGVTMMAIPNELLPAVRALIATSR